MTALLEDFDLLNEIVQSVDFFTVKIITPKMPA